MSAPEIKRMNTLCARFSAAGRSATYFTSIAWGGADYLYNGQRSQMAVFQHV